MSTMFRALVIALLAAVVIATGIVTAGCDSAGGRSMVRGSGNLASETRDVAGFTDVRVEGSGDVTLAQTGAESLKVEADDNVLPLLETTVRGGVLHLAIKPNVDIRTKTPIRYQVTVKELRGLGISGSGSIRASGVDTDRLSSSISGSGSATLAGRADALDLHISGSGSYDATELQSKTASVSISGSGSVKLNASDRLDAHVSGSGSVHYAGNPAVQKHISGSGVVARR